MRVLLLLKAELTTMAQSGALMGGDWRMVVSVRRGIQTVCRCLIIMLIFLRPGVWAADTYFGPASAGANNGTNCANAYAFNDGTHGWSLSAQQLAGTNLHICAGTYTAAANTTILSTVNNGSSGSPITLIADQGAAIFQAPYLSGKGGINIQNSFWTVNGSNNLTIQNTADGTALTYRTTSVGINIGAVNNVTVQGTTIQNIYVNGGASATATDTGGQNTADISVSPNGNSSIFIHDNILNNARSGISISVNGNVDTVQIYNNYISDHCWGIVMGANGVTPLMTNVLINNNEITGWLNWQCPSNAPYCTDSSTDLYHTDGIILWQTAGGSFSPQIFSNYIHGDLGKGSATAFIYCTYGSGTPGTQSTSCIIFNNLLVFSGTGNDDGLAAATTQSSTGSQFYNNTVIGIPGSGSNLVQIDGYSVKVHNNIIENGGNGLAGYNAASSVFALPSDADYNVYVNINGGGTNTRFGYTQFYNWSQWQTAGYDLHSTYIDPQLNSSFQVVSSKSSAYHAGANLTSLGITSLDNDKAGLLRPVSGAWDAGAYQFVSSNSAITPPTGLTATVF